MRVKTKIRGISYLRGSTRENAELEIRITSDAIGKSLSISDPAADIFLMIPLEPLARYLRIKEVKE